MLVHATELPPLGKNKQYRTPDHPFSMFEGLAGAVCAWSEAVVVVQGRLAKRDEFESRDLLLGLPCLGGVGARAVI